MNTDISCAKRPGGASEPLLFIGASAPKDSDFICVHLCSSVVANFINSYSSACSSGFLEMEPNIGLHALVGSRQDRLGVFRATLARLRLGEHRLEERAQLGRVAAEVGVARQHVQQVAAGPQCAASGVEGAQFGAVAAVPGARGGQAGEAFRRVRAGAAPAMHAATAVGHGGSAAGAAGSGARAATGRGIGVATLIAVAERAWLTLHGVLAPFFRPRIYSLARR